MPTTKSHPKNSAEVTKEQNLTYREKYWSELETEGRIDRTREAVRRLIRQVSRLEKTVEELTKHRHTGEGKVVVEKEVGRDEYTGCMGQSVGPMPGANPDDVWF